MVGPGVGVSVGVALHGEGVRLAPPTRASPQPTSRRVTKRCMRPSAAGAISSTCAPPTTAARTARGEPSNQFAESIIGGATEHRNSLGLPRQVPLSEPMAAPCYRTRPRRRLLGRPSRRLGSSPRVVGNARWRCRRGEALLGSARPSPATAPSSRSRPVASRRSDSRKAASVALR